MEEESIAKLLQIPRNLFINYRDPTLIVNMRGANKYKIWKNKFGKN